MYRDQVLPRGIDLVLRGREFAAPRVRAAAGLKGQVLEIGFGSGLNMVAAAGLEGEVLEIGFGSGLNIPFYPAGLKRIRAVDPASTGRRLAARRAAACPVPVEYAGSDAQVLPVGDASVDSVLSTWTLCTVPDAARAPAEIVRVLRPRRRAAFRGARPDAR